MQSLGTMPGLRPHACQRELAECPSSCKERGMDAVPDYSIQERNPARAALAYSDSFRPSSPEVIEKGDARACGAALALCREAKVHRKQSELGASDTLST